jgi:hypothetical protein
MADICGPYEGDPVTPPVPSSSKTRSSSNRASRLWSSRRLRSKRALMKGTVIATAAPETMLTIAMTSATYWILQTCSDGFMPGAPERRMVRPGRISPVLQVGSRHG